MLLATLGYPSNIHSRVFQSRVFSVPSKLRKISPYVRRRCKPGS